MSLPSNASNHSSSSFAVVSNESNGMESLLNGKILIKAKYGDDIRRVQILGDQIIHHELLLMMQRLFKLKSDDRIVLKYRDEENDWISIIDQNDLTMAVSDSRVLKLQVLVNEDVSLSKLSSSALDNTIYRELIDIRNRCEAVLEKFHLNKTTKMLMIANAITGDDEQVRSEGASSRKLTEETSSRSISSTIAPASEEPSSSSETSTINNVEDQKIKNEPQRQILSQPYPTVPPPGPLPPSSQQQSFQSAPPSLSFEQNKQPFFTSTQFNPGVQPSSNVNFQQFQQQQPGPSAPLPDSWNQPPPFGHPSMVSRNSAVLPPPPHFTGMLPQQQPQNRPYSGYPQSSNVGLQQPQMKPPSMQQNLHFLPPGSGQNGPYANAPPPSTGPFYRPSFQQ